MPAIVLLEPQPPLEPPVEAAAPVMDQLSLEFVPKLLFVRTGQPVEFLNSDEVLHNINVKDDATNEQAFNVAIPNGVTYRHTFKQDGFYNVVCDIHPLMAASIVSSSSPFSTIAENDGTFAFENVAPGPYRVMVYAGNQRLTRSIEVTAERTEVSIEGP
jgi:plastocyanin